MSRSRKDYGPRTCSSTLRGGQLSLCADLWAILLYFDLSSDDSVAGKDWGGRIRDRWKVVSGSFLCVHFILILGITESKVKASLRCFS